MNIDFLRSFSRKIKTYPGVWKLAVSLMRQIEGLCWGGKLRERIFVRLLRSLYRSQFRRDWIYTVTPPHFYNQRWNAFDFTYGESRSPYCFNRGFFGSEVLKNGDRVLDIGCGDGFFANSFYSKKCSHIDAIDIDASAIETAGRLNKSPKINFRVMDAIHDPFPADSYDVIVWDGAIGHFPPSSVASILQKIATALSPDGMFIGSESLGQEGADHLQYFENESELAALFKPYFTYVWIRTAEYEIGSKYLRREAYWRCANDTSRQQAAAWIDFAE